MNPPTLLLGDCIEQMQFWLPDNSVDAIVTDPPYGLSFMGKKWDYDVPQVDVWTECLRVLKPGGYLLAFAGTRTQHRMCVNIEDAGFEIRDMIAWVYGSGFPKSLNVSKAIDKAAGAEREVVGVAGKSGSARSCMAGDFAGGEYMETAPATEAARQWQGWGTALKPALEPITVARKPLGEKTVADNVLRWGTGGLNIDGCRVDSGGTHGSAGSVGLGAGRATANTEGTAFGNGLGGVIAPPHPMGRWSANLIHDGSDEVVSCFPASAGAAAPIKGTEPSVPAKGDVAYGFRKRVPAAFHADSGSAARFFYAAKASKADRNSGLDGKKLVIIEPFDSEATELWENEARKVRLHVDMGASLPRVTDVSGARFKSANEWSTLLFGNGRTVQSRQATTFTTKTATNSTTNLEILNCFLNSLTSESTQDVSCERMVGGSLAENAETSTTSITITSALMASVLGAEHAALTTQWRISVSEMRSSHPTIKPVDLMRYLCRLVTQPGGVVLDPFMGSGSTGKAARLEGFNFIGIERDPDYMRIAEARIK